MEYENLLYDVKDQIARITFNRPSVLNALNFKTLDELSACLEAVRRDDSVRVVILTGAGEKAFVAGADINELARQTAPEGKETALRGQSIFRQLETLDKPSIAAINGFALGGGCELALACTIRVASRGARLGQPEVKLGILPGYGASQRLARLCGKGIAHELILTGDMIGADEALRIGLVNRVTEPADLLAAAESIARTIRDGGNREGDGDAARRRIISGSDAVRAVLCHRRHARGHPRVSRKAAGEVSGAIADARERKASEAREARRKMERGGIAFWHCGERLQQLHHRPSPGGRPGRFVARRCGRKADRDHPRSGIA
jgi:enoyl-CoA hydratase